jgi:16S rRNA (cytosine1402-N4)-methyltransferase
VSPHVPVLLDEVIALMHLEPAGCYIDATFGRGGHSRAILDRLGAEGRLLAIDRDPEALAVAVAMAADDPRLTVADARHSALARAAAALARPIDGILFDLGVSSPQLDAGGRGFSFRHDAPLDMRMDPRAGEPAGAWLARAAEAEIADVLWRYGEERHARRIARRVVETRARHPIRTTFELAALVRACYPRAAGRIDPATRSFQAIRIFVNDELGELERALEQAIALLARGGRLLVIAFHSLEDRLVKHYFRALDGACDPAGAAPGASFRLLTRKPVRAGAAECAANPRARSARLRALERAA